MAKKPVAQSTKIGRHLCQKLHKNIHASPEFVPSHAKVGKIQIQFNRSSISVAGPQKTYWVNTAISEYCFLKD